METAPLAAGVAGRAAVSDTIEVTAFFHRDSGVSRDALSAAFEPPLVQLWAAADAQLQSARPTAAQVAQVVCIITTGLAKLAFDDHPLWAETATEASLDALNGGLGCLLPLRSYSVHGRKLGGAAASVAVGARSRPRIMSLAPLPKQQLRGACPLSCSATIMLAKLQNRDT
eukprot:CAMPEP_0181238958 /NCGR_PEP_ID=MMETSP1096-20121128/39652_1 /TAXON_ID=156174 ORGANISM="Chrysochromulina ericina, Strain CCMP281" /NCGR_SAMPLE_ID=MMETSP1096 /ASSEMBLY_ACC=CAM_ASM_000453 /LENGTH=170 /DNA_ID=CAMNT_0023334571 /DNA_START=88 /DNA_END=598 /DNA_ORIENTATION=-